MRNIVSWTRVIPFVIAVGYLIKCGSSLDFRYFGGYSRVVYGECGTDIKTIAGKTVENCRYECDRTADCSLFYFNTGSLTCKLKKPPRCKYNSLSSSYTRRMFYKRTSWSNYTSHQSHVTSIIKQYTGQTFGQCEEHCRSHGECKAFLSAVAEDAVKGNCDLYINMAYGTTTPKAWWQHTYTPRAPELISDESVDNIAFGKQSYVISKSSLKMGPELATDGRHETEAFSSPHSCLETDTHLSDWTWWYVDLGASHDIREVLILARQNDKSSEYLEVLATDSFKDTATALPDNYTLCNSGGVSAGRAKRFVCTMEAKGRYVIVRRISKRSYPMAICEVEVYPRNSYGNIAAGRHAAFNKETAMLATFAVDSSRQTEPDSYYNYFYTICAVSGAETDVTWWHLDMGQLHCIRKVVVTASATALKNYKTSNFYVLLSREFDKGVKLDPQAEGVDNLYYHTGQVMEGQSFVILTNKVGQHLVVQQHKSKYQRLALCQVQVYGDKKTTDNIARGRPIMATDGKWYGSNTSSALLYDGKRETEYSTPGTSNEEFLAVDLSGWFSIKSFAIITGSKAIGPGVTLVAAACRAVGASSLDFASCETCYESNANYMVPQDHAIPIHCSKAVWGRYVYIMVKGSSPLKSHTLTLAELEVYGDRFDGNFAVIGMATQSSTYWTYEANNAINGDTHADLSSNSVSMTLSAAKENWWKLEIPFSIYVSWIAIHSPYCDKEASHPCDTGWSLDPGRKKCFLFVDGAKTRDDAEKDCKTKGGLLVTVRNWETWQFLQKTVIPSKLAWLGLNDKVKNLRFTWNDETEVARFYNFVPGDPIRDKVGTDSCVDTKETTGEKRWYNNKCTQTNNYVCEKLINLPPCMSGAWTIGVSEDDSTYKTCFESGSTNPALTTTEVRKVPCPPKLMGRYIKLTQIGTAPLALSEVKVYSDLFSGNVAVQSSRTPSSGNGPFAIDGRPPRKEREASAKLTAGASTETCFQSSSTDTVGVWHVNVFHAAYIIRKVKITGPEGCCRQENLKVFTSLTFVEITAATVDKSMASGQLSLCAEGVTVESDSVTFVRCRNPPLGMHVYIYKGDTLDKPLILCDVEIYGTKSYGDNCKWTKVGSEYHGKMNVFNGMTCQQWQSQSPNKHTKKSTGFPEQSFIGAVNYCRNPDEDSGGPWCYTTDPKTRYMYCPIPYCSREALNVARHKPTEQSTSKHIGTIPCCINFLSRLANDGDADYTRCTFVSETLQHPTWWKVDLLQQYKIRQVTLTNTIDHRNVWMTNYEIWVSPEWYSDDLNKTAHFLCDGTDINEITTEVHDTDCIGEVWGRYLTVVKHTGPLVLCEVEVSGHVYNATDDNTDNNLALDMPTMQISLKQPDQNSSLAVDGILQPKINLCSQTSGSKNNEWWAVYLVSVYSVEKIVLVNAADRHGSGFANVSVFVINDFTPEILDAISSANGSSVTTASTTQATTTATGSTTAKTVNIPKFTKCGSIRQLVDGQMVLIKCPAMALGRYVVLMKDKSQGDPLVVCEVQVYGTLHQLLTTTTESKPTTFSTKPMQTTTEQESTTETATKPPDEFPVIAVAVGATLGGLALGTGLVFLILYLLRKPPFQNCSKPGEADEDEVLSSDAFSTPRSITAIDAKIVS